MDQALSSFCGSETCSRTQVFNSVLHDFVVHSLGVELYPREESSEPEQSPRNPL